MAEWFCTWGPHKVTQKLQRVFSADIDGLTEGQQMPSDRSVPENHDSAPALDTRIGGFRMTFQRIPVRLLTVLMTCGGSAFTAWFTTR
jgi:hypothetical protein